MLSHFQGFIGDAVSLFFCLFVCLFVCSSFFYFLYCFRIWGKKKNGKKKKLLLQYLSLCIPVGSPLLFPCKSVIL